jgi:hypothetical protein
MEVTGCKMETTWGFGSAREESSDIRRLLIASWSGSDGDRVGLRLRLRSMGTGSGISCWLLWMSMGLAISSSSSESWMTRGISEAGLATKNLTLESAKSLLWSNSKQLRMSHLLVVQLVLLG